MSKQPLRLSAQDADDLAILSAATQDAIVRMGDIAVDRAARRLVIEMARFRWEAAKKRGPYWRTRSVLSFDGVLRTRTRRLRIQDKDAFGSLLAIAFEPASEPPGGLLRVVLAGDAEIAMEVECIDVLLLDTGPSWPTPVRPNHERA